MKDKLESFFILLVSTISMYLIAVIFYSIGLTFIGPIPTAEAGDLSQYKQYMAEATSPHNIHKEFQSFRAWEIKKVFKKTLSELKIEQDSVNITKER
jgi:hypothetical protein